MTSRQIILLAGLGSLAMLVGAFGFQYFADLAPCKMCLWQRWPHAIAAALGILVFLVPNRFLAFLGMLVVAIGAGIAIYHSGVELKWWLGPQSCTSGPISGLTTAELLDKIMKAPIVRCDEIPWQMFGLSMAAWNAVISLLLSLLWLGGALGMHRQQRQ